MALLWEEGEVLVTQEIDIHLATFGYAVMYQQLKYSWGRISISLVNNLKIQTRINQIFAQSFFCCETKDFILREQFIVS